MIAPMMRQYIVTYRPMSGSRRVLEHVVSAVNTEQAKRLAVIELDEDGYSYAQIMAVCAKDEGGVMA